MKIDGIAKSLLQFNALLQSILLASAAPLTFDPIGDQTFTEGQSGSFVVRATQSSSSSSENFYVSPTGKDSWSGTLPSPNAAATDGPFASLERARDAVRARKQAVSLPAGGVTIWLRGGLYFRDKSLDLSSQDSGVIWSAWPGETVQIVGGKEVTNFGPVTGNIQNRLNATQLANIRQASLPAQGLSDYGTLARRGRYYAQSGSAPTAMEISFGGQPMTLARWPNANDTTWFGFTNIAAAVSSTAFRYSGTRPSSWQEPVNNIWVFGYFDNDWDDLRERVTALNTSTKQVTLASAPVYGISSDRRIYFENILEELDQPGEYYIDRATGMLYLWPPAAVGGANRVLASVLATQLIQVNGASDLTFKGLILESTRNSAFRVQGGNRVRFEACTLRNVGVDGGSFDSTTRNSGLYGCNVYNTGDRGIVLDGGDRRTLTPANNYVTSCTFTNFGRLVRTYSPAVMPKGVGNKIDHNVMAYAAHEAIELHGNDHVVEYNHIHHVCTETTDSGVIYMSRDFTERGHQFRYNLIHDVLAGNGATTPGRTQVFYFDDNSSGSTVFGNICYNVNRSVLIHGGRDHRIENNIFADNTPYEQVIVTRLSPLEETLGLLAAMPYRTPPWSTRYPELVNVLEAPDDPLGNKLIRNIRSGPSGMWTDFVPASLSSMVTQQNNFITGDPQFVDYAAKDFRLRSTSPALAQGFQQIPVDQIGLLASSAPASRGSLVYSASNLPSGATFDPATQTLSWTPSDNQAGTYPNIRFNVTDGVSTAETTVTFTVLSANRAPQLTAVGDRNVAAGSAVQFTIGASDPDGDPITYSATGLPAGANFNSVTRQFAWTPSNNQTGTHAVTFSASDGVLSDSERVEITVSGANQPPNLSAIPNQSTTVGVGISVNFTVGDPESSPGGLGVSASSSATTVVPDSGLVLGGTGANRTLTITPAPGQTGTASILLTVSDGALTATRNFSVTVNPAPTTQKVSLAFEAEAGSLVAPLEVSGTSVRSISSETSQRGSATFTVQTPVAGAYTIWCRVLARSGEADSFFVSVDGNEDIYDLTEDSWSNNWQWTQVNGRAGGAPLTLDPRVFNLSAGPHTVVFRAREAGAAIDRFIVTNDPEFVPSEASNPIVNAPPTLSAIAAQSTVEDVPKTIAFTIADQETPVGQLNVMATSSNPALVPAGNIAISSFVGPGANRRATITPLPHQSGNAAITLTVSDGTNTASRTFVLTVTDVNHAPVPGTAFFTTAEDTPLVISIDTLLARASDPDAGDRLTISKLSATSLEGGTLRQVQGAILYTPPAGLATQDRFTYSLSDQAGGEATGTVQVTITPKPQQDHQVSIPIWPGFNLIANPFIHGSNTVAEVLANMPAGTMFYKFDNQSRDYQVNTFEFGEWSNPTETLRPGEGGFLLNPAPWPFTMTLTGQPNTSRPASYAEEGFYLIGSLALGAEPLMQAVSQDVADGDVVYRFEPESQSYSIHSYYGLGIWDEEPILQAGESVFIKLAPR
jgi:hypothetical protein